MWTTNLEGKVYWITDPLPENTEEYKLAQTAKFYKTNNGIINHPGWIYDTGVVVDDDYLFFNDNYKLIIDNVPLYNRKTQVLEKNAPHLWTENEKTVEVTYNIRNKTQDEIDADISKEWDIVKKLRNEKLTKLDPAVFIAVENGFTLSQEFKTYRQQLRDVTEDFTDPYEVVWPNELDPFSYYD